MAIQIGVITALIGSATVLSADGMTHSLQLGDKVYYNDLVKTGKSCALEVEFADGNVLDLSRDSQLLLDKTVFDPFSSFSSSHELSVNVDAIHMNIMAGDDPLQVSAVTVATKNAFVDTVIPNDEHTR